MQGGYGWRCCYTKSKRLPALWSELNSILLEFDVSSLLYCFLQGTLVLPPSSKNWNSISMWVVVYKELFCGYMLSVKQLFIYLCIYSFHSFIRSFSLSFVRSLVRSFVHLFTHYVNIFWDELITILKFLPTLILKIFYLAVFARIMMTIFLLIILFLRVNIWFFVQS